jgi:hypothetical protein
MSAYDELYLYTMNHSGGRSQFILQLVVDAQTAQTATTATKPMGLVFALLGLYLHVEKGFTGRQVQDAHIRMGRKKHAWPAIAVPKERGAMTADDVMPFPAGRERDAAIDDWCRSVWTAYADARAAIIGVLEQHRIV